LLLALSLADGDTDPRTTISLIGSEGRVDATTAPNVELRLRQPQMADWTATISTNQTTQEISCEPDGLPLVARNPARLYQVIRNDLRDATTTAPTP